MDPFFIYLLKCGGIMVLFYAVYRLLLQQQTFFNYNRYFLLSGIVIALLLPLLVFTKIVYIEQTPLTYSYVNPNAVNSLSSFNTIDWSAVFPVIYWMGVSLLFGRLIVQLLSLLKLISSSTIIKDGSFKMVATKTNVTPFSFFNYIVYHPGSYNNRELNTIIEHEKTHANQWHSVDIILVHMLTVFLWFVPFVWIYKKCIAQNLEYIADNETARKVQCRKNYQYLLLNASAKAYKPAITNNFFNSLIKKRIVMLNKNRSQQKNVWRYSVILPFLMVFLLVFNVKTVAQVRVVKKAKDNDVEVMEHVQFSIDKNTTSKGLSKLKAKIKSDDGKFTYEDLERNDDGEITSITIKFRDDEGRFVTGNYTDDDGIEPIIFGNNEKGGVFITSGNPHNHGEYYFREHTDADHDVMIRKKGGKGKNEGEHKKMHKVKKMKHGDHDIHIDEDSDHDVIVVGRTGKGEKKKRYKVKKMKHGDHDIHVDEDSDHDVIVVGRTGKGEKKKVYKLRKTKDSDDNDDNDMEEYLDDDDVIVIEKNGKGEKKKMRKVKKRKHGDHDGVLFIGDDHEDALVLVDGRESTKEKIESMDTKEIESIEVMKGDGAVEKYGRKAKNGVIIITTKKD